MSLVKGHKAEKEAELYLAQQGLEIVENNFRCKSGEIDLIMKDQEELVFIEVKARKADDYGSAAEMVGPNKQRKLISAAKLYLLQNYENELPCCRFDVLEINQFETESSELHWHKNAFELQGFSIL